MKDPASRARALLARRGAAAPSADAEILVGALELREALAEAGTAEAVEVVGARIAEGISRCGEALSLAFDRDDLAGAGRETLRLQYLTKAAADARARRAAIAR